MRVTFFLLNSILAGGGAEKWIAEVTKRLSDRHETQIIGLEYAPQKRWTQAKVLELGRYATYHELPSFKLPRGDAIPIHFGRLLDLFNSSDVLYVLAPYPPSESLLYILRRCIKPPIIMGFHGFPRREIWLQRLYLPILEHSLKAFDCFHVLNRRTYDWLRGLGYNPVFLIPNGVDTSKFRLSRSSHGKNFDVLYTGRLTQDKGADILAKVIQGVNSRGDSHDIRFIVTGSGDLESIIRESSAKYNNVRYLGFVSESDIPRVYALSSLFLIPSRSEGMPMRLLEAQSSGLPVVGSNLPWIEDMVQDGKNGCLVDVEDIKGFVKAINKYYDFWKNEPERYYKLKKRIAESVIETFDWSAILPRFERMLQVVRRKQAPMP